MAGEHAVRMSLAEHLDELRTRLIRSIAYLSIAAVIAMIFYKDLVRIVTLPHFRAMEWCGLPHEHTRLTIDHYVTSVMGVMRLVLIAALVVASPLIAREFWAFVAAGLYRQERKYVARFAPISFLLFLLGCSFGYFVLIPHALYGMTRFMPGDVVQPLFQFSGYLSLFLTLTILLGAVFQLPLLMVFLSSLGVVRAPSWGQWRRHAIVANVILAAVISPPDPVSMIVFALPLFLLYETGVVFASFARPETRTPEPRP